MSKLTEEFEKIRYGDDSLSADENEERRKRKTELLKEMSEEEFREIIAKTGTVQQKIAYKKIRDGGMHK